MSQRTDLGPALGWAQSRRPDQKCLSADGAMRGGGSDEGLLSGSSSGGCGEGGVKSFGGWGWAGQAEPANLSGAGEPGRPPHASAHSIPRPPREDLVVPTEPPWQTEVPPSDSRIVDDRPMRAAASAPNVLTAQQRRTSGQKRRGPGSVAPDEHVPLPYVRPRLHHRRHRGGGRGRGSYGSWSAEASDDGIVSGGGSEDVGGHRPGECFGGPPSEPHGYSMPWTPAGYVSAVHPPSAPSYPSPSAAAGGWASVAGSILAPPWPTLQVLTDQSLQAEGGRPRVMAGTFGIGSGSMRAAAAAGDGLEGSAQGWRTAGDRMAVESGGVALGREENAGEMVDRALHDICVRYVHWSGLSCLAFRLNK